MVGSGSEKLMECPPSFLAVLWFMNVCETKPDRKKKKNGEKTILTLVFLQNVLPNS